MKATLFLTMSCNLRCDYCYIKRKDKSMSGATLAKAVNFAFRMAQAVDRLDFGLFGGEPLLNPPLVREAVSMVERKAESVTQDVRLSLVTNGTLLNDDILNYLRDHHVILQVSCDGAPHVQDKHRRFPNGSGSSVLVEANLKSALKRLPAVLVNIVYGPDTHSSLPQSISYLASLGLKQLILNPDYSAAWGAKEIDGLKETYMRIADLYLEYYHIESPMFISLIDEKLAVILRGGYGPSERCHMGYSELAFSPQGFIYPCERLVGSGDRNRHCIGHLNQLETLQRGHCQPDGNSCKSIECQQCGVADFCMNWCGCSNYFGSGDYSRPSHFICVSERFAIEATQKVLTNVENDNQLIFIHHYAGLPMVNSSM